MIGEGAVIRDAMQPINVARAIETAQTFLVAQHELVITILPNGHSYATGHDRNSYTAAMTWDSLEFERRGLEQRVIREVA